MSYRFGEKRPPKPNRSMQITSTPNEIYVDNGSTNVPFAYYNLYANLELPKRVKNPEVIKEWGGHYHYHPEKPFHRYKKLMDYCTPIHVMDEYTVTKADGTKVTPELEMSLEGAVSGITIDKTSIEDYIFYVWFSVNCPTCTKEKGIEHFTLKLKYPILSSDKTSVTWGKEIACTGRIVIKPAIL